MSNKPLASPKTVVRFGAVIMFFAVAAFAQASPEIEGGAIDENNDYQPYADCVRGSAKDTVPDLLRMRKLSKTREGLLERVAKCASLLPAEGRSELTEQIGETLVLVTELKAKDGVKKGRASITSGVVIQSTSGASLMLAGDAELKFPRQSIFSLTEGYQLRLSGYAYVGSTANGVSGLPAARVSLNAGRNLQLYPTDDEQKILDQYQIELGGVAGASLNELIGVTFDRNVALDRPWDLSAHYGREAVILGGKGGDVRGAAIMALAEAGVGQSGDGIIPYLRLTVAGQGYLCKRLADRHLVCVNGEAAVSLGAVQARLGVGVGIDYRYIANLPADESKWIHSVSVGPQLHQDLEADLKGGHAATTATFGVTIK